MSTLSEEISRRRTFAIISHPDAGKTTLTEKFLLYGGAIAQAGVVKGKKNRRAAVSDWMEIEKQRGISVTSSVMQFQYGGFCINILDTPGHQDFSEDTYRTLMAADSAVMVIDGSKGVEAQTRKLFKVCAMRHIPIFTFVNKMDREAKDPFDLLEELERELGIETYAMNWPIGSGKEFQGVYDRQGSQLLFFSSGSAGKNRAGKQEIDLYDPQVSALLGEGKHRQLIDEVELLGAGRDFDLEEVRAGKLSPVFFGSALTNFGVEPFLEEFLRLTPPPASRVSDIIGVFDPGIFSIGDTVTVPGKKFKFSGIPTFAPEHFARVSARDSMKRKQFVKGTEQIAQEGAIQIFKVPGSGMEEVIVGVVGVLQFDVFQYRMKNEYGVELRMDHLPYEELRLIDSYPGDLQDLNLGSDAELLEDYRDRKLLVFTSFWAIDFTCRRNPGLQLSEITVDQDAGEA